MSEPTIDTSIERRVHRTVLGGSWTRRVLFGVGGVVLLGALWQVLVSIYALDPVTLPSPVMVLQQLATQLGRAEFRYDILVSLFEFGVGFGIGTFLAVLVGLAMAELLRVRMFLNPVVQIFRFIVPFAWIPLTVLWFGTSFIGKIWLVAYAVFFVMVVSTEESVRRVDPTLTLVATMLGMGRVERAFSVHLRAAAPGIASASRAAAGIGWIAVVAAEYIGSSSGLGYVVINAQQTLQTDVVIAGMVVIGLIGAVFSAGIGWASRRWLAYV